MCAPKLSCVHSSHDLYAHSLEGTLVRRVIAPAVSREWCVICWWNVHVHMGRWGVRLMFTWEGVKSLDFRVDIINGWPQACRCMLLLMDNASNSSFSLIGSCRHGDVFVPLRPELAGRLWCRHVSDRLDRICRFWSSVKSVKTLRSYLPLPILPSGLGHLPWTFPLEIDEKNVV